MTWGLATLILLLVTAAVFVILREIADNRELDKQLAEAEELVEQINQRKVSENNPLPQESVDDSQQIDSRIGSDLSDVSDEQSTEVKLTEAHIKQLREQARKEFYQQIRGVNNPPPDGYTYRIDASGKALRDENGDPILHKIGEPRFTVNFQKGFAPTVEQYRLYKQLEQDRIHAIKDKEYSKLKLIELEMEQLRERAKGDLPIIAVTTINYHNVMDSHSVMNSFDVIEKSNRLKYQEYKKLGLDHLIPEEYK